MEALAPRPDECKRFPEQACFNTHRHHKVLDFRPLVFVPFSANDEPITEANRIPFRVASCIPSAANLFLWRVFLSAACRTVLHHPAKRGDRRALGRATNFCIPFRSGRDLDDRDRAGDG